MSTRLLRRPLIELVSDMRAAGKNAHRSAREEIVDRFFEHVPGAADPYASYSMSTGRREAGMDKLRLAIEHRTPSGAVAIEAAVPWSRRVWGLPRLRPIVLGLCAAAILAIAVLSFLRLPSRDDQLVAGTGGPSSGKPNTPIGPRAPEKGSIAQIAPEGKRQHGPALPLGETHDAIVPDRTRIVGRFVAVMGEPKLYVPGSTDAITPIAGAEISFESRIETGDADKVEIEFNDGTKVKLDFNTSVWIPDLNEESRKLLAAGTRPIPRPESISLEAGKLYASVTHLPDERHFRVETAAATAEVLGTKFELGLDKAQIDSKVKATLKVTEGRVAFYNALGRVEAGKRTQTEALQGSRPTEPERMNSHKVFILSRDERFEAASFQLDHQSALRKLVYPLSSIGAEFSSTPEGTVYVRAVRPGSPADEGGIRSGSIVLAVDGLPVLSATHLRGLVGDSAGRRIRMRTIREHRIGEEEVSTGFVLDNLPFPANLDPSLLVATKPILQGAYRESKSRLLVLSRSKASSAVFNNLGVACEALDELGPAIRNYQICVSLDPQVSLFRGNLGHALKAIGNFPRAIEELRASVALDAANAAARMDLAELLSILRRNEEGLAVLASAPNGEPMIQAKMGILRSRIYSRIGDLALAERACRQALAVVPEFSDAWTQLTWVLYFQGRTDESLAAGRKAIELDPGSGYAFDALGAPLRFLPSHEKEAEQVYRRSFELLPWDSISIASFSDILHSRRDFREYRRLNQGALMRGVAGIMTYAYLIKLASETESIEGSEKLYREAVARWPEDPDLHSALAHVYFYNGRLVEAESLLRLTLELDPGHVIASVKLVRLYALTKRLLEAERVCRDLMAARLHVRPTSDEEAKLLLLSSRSFERAGHILSFFYGLPGEEVSGLTEYRKWIDEERAARLAFEKAPRSEDALRSLVAALCNLGREKEAAALCRDSLAKDGFNPRIALLMARCLMDGQADLREAVLLAERVVVLHDEDSFRDGVSTLVGLRIRLGQLQAAKALFGEGNPGWSDSPQMVWSFGDVLLECGLVEEAFSYYRKAAALDQTPRHTVELVKRLSTLRRNRQALEVIHAALLAHPGDSEWMAQMFVPYSRFGDISGVLEMGRNALAVKPNDPDLQVAMGRVLKDNGDLAGAIRMFRESIRNPEMPQGPGLIEQPWSEIAVIYENQGRLDLAISAIREVVRIQPKNEWAQGRLSDLLKKVSRQR